ncbi:hypothetical protein K461DRAFT_33303 [Myriangium duriaei CBS 260.36]|uniref:Secreted protein n=1 Tax=Myriangium duriaei CBS 260.36 TaxID=1168546 RepID=A0A9P4IWD2_9PEZI|nr:hypothetical protein K461DRAFT_33303 [Myriangium duriaei CBS 260.36]
MASCTLTSPAAFSWLACLSKQLHAVQQQDWRRDCTETTSTAYIHASLLNSLPPSGRISETRSYMHRRCEKHRQTETETRGSPQHRWSGIMESDAEVHGEIRGRARLIFFLSGNRRDMQEQRTRLMARAPVHEGSPQRLMIPVRSKCVSEQALQRKSVDRPPILRAAMMYGGSTRSLHNVRASHTF